MQNRPHPAAAAVSGALLTLLLAATPALADPPPGMGTHSGMGMHPGMGMGQGMGPEMGMHADGMGMGMGDHGGGGHGFGPHNAAIHFLKMADALGLDGAQTAKLRKLRDAWIDTNAASEAHLEAAQNDLKGLLFADSIDLKAVEGKLAEIGPIESQLWRAFAQQLLEIKAMLNDDQRAHLRERMRRHPM